MAVPGPFDSFPIGMDGMCVVNGVSMNYVEYLSLLDRSVQDHVDALKDLRDPQSDTQNLWGNKKNRYIDDWYGGRVRPINSQEGKYPNEIGSEDWKP